MSLAADSTRRLARCAATAGVGFAVLLLLRTHVAQRYLIPSRSMEPTLHGDPRGGDIVLVDKLGVMRPHCVEALRRFDTVVLQDEGGAGDPLVKRVISTGDEMLRIADGDVFVRPLSGGAWERVQKDPLAHRDLRFTFFEHRAGASDGEAPARYLAGEFAGDGSLELRAVATDVSQALAAIGAPAVPHHGRALGSTRSIDNSFVDASGRRSFAGDRCSNDVGWELELDLTDDCRGVALTLLQHDRVLGLAFARDGLLTCSDPARMAAEQTSSPATCPALGRRVDLAFGYLDGRLFLEVDGRLAALVPWPLPADTESAGNSLRLAVAGPEDAVCARARRVRLFHDVYYHPENRPYAGLREYRVEPGEVFLLGDNTFDSTDSRRRGPFAAADIVGRPVAVIGPWARARWLPR